MRCRPAATRQNAAGADLPQVWASLSSFPSSASVSSTPRQDHRGVRSGRILRGSDSSRILTARGFSRRSRVVGLAAERRPPSGTARRLPRDSPGLYISDVAGRRWKVKVRSAPRHSKIAAGIDEMGEMRWFARSENPDRGTAFHQLARCPASGHRAHLVGTVPGVREDDSDQRRARQPGPPCITTHRAAGSKPCDLLRSVRNQPA